MKPWIALALMASSLFSMCEEEDDDTVLLAILAAASVSNTTTAVCNANIKSNVGASAQTLTFASDPSSTSSSNTHVAFFSSSNVTTSHEITLNSTAATMTSVEIKAYAGTDCSAISGTDLSSSLFTSCTGSANSASCGFTANGNYVFKVSYSTSVADMTAVVGIP